MFFPFPAAKSHLWSIADQTLVSGCNFFCGILLARVLGLDAFGAYVVVQTYLHYANTFQGALVVSPMMTSVPAEPVAEKRRSLLHGFFGYALLVLGATILLVQSLAWLLGRWFPAIGLSGLGLPLAAAMAGFQLQDWLRRACYSESDNRRVFFGDFLAYGGHLALLMMLAITNKLSPEAALWSMASAFSLSTTTMLFDMRMWPDRRMALLIVREHWRSSRDFFASWQLQWLASQGVILFGTAMVGQQAAGAIRAAQNLLGPVNVCFQWMDNVVPVRAAVRLRDSGRGALGSYLWHLCVIGILVLGIFTAMLSVIDEPLIVMLYGEDYRPFAVLVVYQALYYLFGHAYRMASYFQRALGETQTLAMASVWWALIAMFVAWLFVGRLGEQGIMVALVLGEVAGLIYLLTRHKVQNGAGTHCVLRRGDGSPQLLLPIANRKLLLATLGMYSPSRWTGRLYQQWLSWSLPLQLRFKMLEFHPDLLTCYPHMGILLATLPGITPVHSGVLLSKPGPHTKLTLKLMDETATVHAFARLAFGEKAMAAIRREASVLTTLQYRACSAQVPKVLRHTELHDPDAYFLIESAGPETRSESNLTVKHFEFLAHLVTGNKVSWFTSANEQREEISLIVSGTSFESLCISACDVLASSPIINTISCIEHGDFTPWNIRRSQDGSLFFIDWEHVRFNGLPWFDALHFVYQMEVLVRRRSPLRVKHALLLLFDTIEAERYSSLFPTLKGNEEVLVISFLLRMLIVGASEGYPLNSEIQRTRLSVLETFMRKYDW